MTFYVNLIELFQLPATPVTSEDDKKGPKRHLAVSSLNKCNAVRAMAAAIARGKRNLDFPVLASHRLSTKTGGRSFQPAFLIYRLIFTYDESQVMPR